MNKIKDFYSLLIILIVEILFIGIAYKVIFKMDLNVAIVFFGLTYTLIRSADINGMKCSNGRFKLFYMITNLFTLLMWCMLMVICLSYSKITSDNIVKLSKSKLFLTSIFYTSIYYYNNWRIIKKNNEKPREYTEIMYEIQSMILGAFYIVFSALWGDRVIEILYLGPVVIGVIMIIYNKKEKLRDKASERKF